MTAPLFDRLAFSESTRRRLEIRGDASRHIASQALDWPGVLLEAGRNYVTGADAVALGYHYIGLNTDRRAIVLRGVDSSPAGGDVTLASGSVWIVPAGDPVTMTVDPLHNCVRIAIEPGHADALLQREGGGGGRIELRRTYGVDAPQLRHLMMALVAESDSGTSSGLAFVEALTAAVSRQLVLHAGVRRPQPEPARGGLSPVARRRVLELIDAKLDGQLSVGTLAREAGLSPAHFARAFKETTGQPPHRFLLSRRLERARRMLEGCEAQLSDVAARAGFADQAHLTRHFKREFGVTPGAVARSTRRRCA